MKKFTTWLVILAIVVLSLSSMTGLVLSQPVFEAPKATLICDPFDSGDPDPPPPPCGIIGGPIII